MYATNVTVVHTEHWTPFQALLQTNQTLDSHLSHNCHYSYHSLKPSCSISIRIPLLCSVATEVILPCERFVARQRQIESGVFWDTSYLRPRPDFKVGPCLIVYVMVEVGIQGVYTLQMMVPGWWMKGSWMCLERERLWIGDNNSSCRAFHLSWNRALLLSVP